MKHLKHFAAFLATVRSALNATSPTSSGPSVHWVVLGNESADLDSAISSLLYAYALSLPGGTPRQQLAAPILPIPRGDMVLRTEITAFLSSLGLDATRDLFFADDLHKLYPAGSSGSSLTRVPPKLALVDFNALPPSLAHLHPCVSAIVDHHVDAGLFTDASPRVIEPVGSATSLVVRECAAAVQDLAPDVRAEFAHLALGPILLDTIHLNPAMQRTTPVDEAAVALCRAWLPEPIDTLALYTHMLKAKVDIAHLATPDLLRKDYKEWDLGNAKYGMASVMLDLHAWIRRDGGAAQLDTAARAYAQARKLHSLYVLTAFEDAEGGFHRQLAVVMPDATQAQAEMRARIVRALQSRDETKGVQVQVAPGQDEADAELVVYDLGKHVSRKVLQPLLHRVLMDL